MIVFIKCDQIVFEVVDPCYWRVIKLQIITREKFTCKNSPILKPVKKYFSEYLCVKTIMRWIVLPMMTYL